jgi:glutaredoxin
MLAPETIVVYSTVWCPDCKRAKQFLGDHRIPYMNVDIEQDAAAMALVERMNAGKRVIPTIVFPDGSILIEPSNAQLAEKFGLQTKARQSFYDAIVIGAGPAGLTAALYLGREGISALVIEQAGLGGQIGTTQTLDNFPGFDEGIAVRISRHGWPGKPVALGRKYSRRKRSGTFHSKTPTGALRLKMARAIQPRPPCWRQAPNIVG